MYEDEIMEQIFHKKNEHPGVCNCSRDWKERFWKALFYASLVFSGAVIGIGLCNFWPEFWYFVNWGLGQ